MGEHRRWPSCLTVEIPVRKIRGNSGRAGWEGQGKPQRVTFSGPCHSWGRDRAPRPGPGAVQGAGDAAVTKSCCGAAGAW